MSMITVIQEAGNKMAIQVLGQNSGSLSVFSSLYFTEPSVSIHLVKTSFMVH